VFFDPPLRRVFLALLRADDIGEGRFPPLQQKEKSSGARINVASYRRMVSDYGYA
jgi:hypothetical protein